MYLIADIFYLQFSYKCSDQSLFFLIFLRLMKLISDLLRFNFIQL